MSDSIKPGSMIGFNWHGFSKIGGLIKHGKGRGVEVGFELAKVDCNWNKTLYKDDGLWVKKKVLWNQVNWTMTYLLTNKEPWIALNILN